MSPEPALDLALPGGEVRSVALVLHGGRASSQAAVRPTNLTVIRMAPFAASLRRAGRRHGLAVGRLRYLVRGWNGTARSPVADVQWALGRVAERHPGVPIALVGHSMGARAAVHAAAHPAVRAVAGLAPWLEPGDPIETVTDRHVLVAHGERDRITDPRGSAGWTRRAQQVAASSAYVSVSGEGHAMLHRAALWHSMTTAFVLATVCDVSPQQTGDTTGGNVIAKVLAGDASLVV